MLALVAWLHRTIVQRKQAALRAVSAERGRISREVHDAIAPGFVAISAQLLTLRRTAPEIPEGLAQRIDGILAGSSMTAARRLAWDLRPELLNIETFQKTLAEVIDRARMNGLSVEIVTHGHLRRIPSVTADNLVRIMQEALNNAAVHARAQHARVELRFSRFGLVLRVQEDGRGFRINSADAGRGLGLTMMRERAAQIGARLTLKSEPGQGTEVQVTLTWLLWGI
jgi:signal transduction histidine kinase